MNEQKPRVLISSNLYRPNIGGAENSLYNLAKEYSHLGYMVDIVTSDMNNVTDKVLPLVEEEYQNVTVYRYQCDHSFIPRTFYMYWTATRLFKKLTKQHDYRYLFVRSHFNVITAWLAGIRDIRFLLAGVVKNQRANERASLSSSRATRLKRYLDNQYHHLLQAIAIKLAPSLMVFSQNMVDQIGDVFKYKKAIPIVKPGVDLGKFSLVESKHKVSLRNTLNIPQDKTVLLGIGRFVQSKGYDQVIASLPLLPDSFCLCLVGQGVEQESYRKLAIKYGVEHKVIYAPPTDKPQEYYQLADVFLMTSVYETLGQTTLEAQSCGLPVVAFEPCDKIVTATKEITSNNTAVFCHHNNAQKLAEAISEADSHLKNGKFVPKEIRQFVIDNFSWQALCKKIDGVNT